MQRINQPLEEIHVFEAAILKYADWQAVEGLTISGPTGLKRFDLCVEAFRRSHAEKSL